MGTRPRLGLEVVHNSSVWWKVCHHVRCATCDMGIRLWVVRRGGIGLRSEGGKTSLGIGG